jgi:hypothetical protein
MQKSMCLAESAESTAVLSDGHAIETDSIKQACLPQHVNKQSILKCLMSRSTLAVAFTFGASLQTKGHAAECIRHLVQEHATMLDCADLCASYRLGSLVLRAMQASNGAGERFEQPAAPIVTHP